MTSIRWSGDREGKPAPEPLRRVQAFINTLDLESGQDRLANAGDARPWLIDNDLLSPDSTLGGEDLRQLAGFREGLRALVIQNSGGPAPTGPQAAALRAITDANAIDAGVDVDGRVTLAAHGDSLRARLLSLLLVVRDAQLDGTWTHLKACTNDGCRWAFYDRSRNHGGTWCDMATCGNKLKNREFRARRKRPAD